MYLIRFCCVVINYIIVFYTFLLLQYIVELYKSFLMYTHSINNSLIRFKHKTDL